MSSDKAQLDLLAVVERAYRIFAQYRPGDTLATCRCPQCMDDETMQLLLRTPLKDIDQRLLSEYTWSANGTNDPHYNPDELRYFLPRYFEFIAAGIYPCFGDEEPTLRQLGHLQYRRHWPREEIAVVDDFFASLIRARISRPPGWYTDEQSRLQIFTEIESVLCLAVHAGGDLGALLDVWEETPEEPASIHLAALVMEAKSFIDLDRGFPGPFWRDFASEGAALKSWVFRAQTADRLAVAEALASDELTRNLMRDALTDLRSN